MNAYVKRIEELYDGNFISKKNHYNFKDDIIKIDVLNLDGEIIGTTDIDYEYDDHNNKVIEKRTNYMIEQGIHTSETNYINEYDSKHRLIQITEMNQNQCTNLTRYIYSEHRLERKEIYLGESFEIAENISYYTYDDDNQLIEEKVCLGSEVISYYVRDLQIISPIKSKFSWILTDLTDNFGSVTIKESVITPELLTELLEFVRIHTVSSFMLVISISDTDTETHRQKLEKIEKEFLIKYKISVHYIM